MGRPKNIEPRPVFPLRLRESKAKQLRSLAEKRKQSPAACVESLLDEADPDFQIAPADTPMPPADVTVHLGPTLDAKPVVDATPLSPFNRVRKPRLRSNGKI